ncbi:MAG: class I SAM-dependent methyltransferase [Solirubrobacteraceae bacterium]|nr:class I SAM-dependent methyltransferase [Solirubrobacteraceae bacterium]
MSAHPWTLYEAALDSGTTLTARHADGVTELLAVSRWLADADPVDERLVARARGPVLDVGCGPGRHVHALVRRKIPALGLDASPLAVRIASERGAEAILGDVFTHGLEVGVWETVLLLDGNLGIGGDPGALLARVREFLTPTGTVLVETDAPGQGARSVPVRLEKGDDVSLWFPWARVCNDAIEEIALGAGLVCADRWSDGGRWFAELRCA